VRFMDVPWLADSFAKALPTKSLAPLNARPGMPCWVFETTPVASAAVCRLVISLVTFVLFFYPASRG